jgi:opacity protein-like surface antigen
LEKGAEFSGVGFAYDFLLGVAYRVADNWSLQVDYRYFLTAANDEYDRIQSHVWLFSASVDL